MKTLLNKKVGEPTLGDVCDLLKRDIFLSLNCHALATIESLDAENRTVTAKLNYCQTFVDQDPVTGKQKTRYLDYPALVDCPFIVLGGGGASLTFPIAKGDQCLILFLDRDMDNWIRGARSGPLASNRLHSFSDAIALIGLNTATVVASDRSTWSKGTTKLSVGAKIEFQNSAATLKSILEDLGAVLNQIGSAISGGVGIPPGTTAAIAASVSAVNSKISGLLQ